MYFFVRGSAGGVFRLRHDTCINIDVIQRNSVVARWCGGPVNVPVYDTLLGQKLWLEADELGFRTHIFPYGQTSEYVNPEGYLE